MSNLKEKRKEKKHWLICGHGDDLATEYSNIHQHNLSRVESFNAGKQYQTLKMHKRLELQAEQNALDTTIHLGQIKNLEGDNNYLQTENEKLWQIIANLKLKQENDKNRK